MPKKMRHEPKPAELLPTDDAGKLAVLDRVSAVLSGKSPRALTTLTSELDKRFEWAERFKAFDVRVRPRTAPATAP